ncbi:hypothetical protein L3Q82_001477 [Scortum barcoo]|uniref:Uncharacterized protein n=1 Tax=Scortum barcoo TaxID=214431 RepID=A0ACB8W877_9TELE|nr:hypothetical protein L3Q82_001477 [Scortum barcoo]
MPCCEMVCQTGLESWQEFLNLIAANKKKNLWLFSRLRETLNPQMCGGFVDAFLKSEAKSGDQVQEELSRVIGSRQVQLEDSKNLPFTDAVLHETQRLANILPMALPHRTSQDVTFQGHFIKKVAGFVSERIWPGWSSSSSSPPSCSTFAFTPPPGVSEDELDLTPHVGLTLNPSPHKLCAISCLAVSTKIL